MKVRLATAEDAPQIAVVHDETIHRQDVVVRGVTLENDAVERVLLD